MSKSVPWMCTFADCVRRSNLIYWSGWCKQCVAPATDSPLETRKEAEREVNGSDVDFRARAARGHFAAGPVSGPADRSHLDLDSGGRLPVPGLAAGHLVPPRPLAAPALANRPAQPGWDLGRYRGPGGPAASAQTV